MFRQTIIFNFLSVKAARPREEGEKRDGKHKHDTLPTDPGGSREYSVSENNGQIKLKAASKMWARGPERPEFRSVVASRPVMTLEKTIDPNDLDL